jgi:hypothetical protein
MLDAMSASASASAERQRAAFVYAGGRSGNDLRMDRPVNIAYVKPCGPAIIELVRHGTD